MSTIVSLNKNYEFQRLYKRGDSAPGAYFVLYARRNGGNSNRLGITVSKKVGGAVQRNRAKRRLKEIYRTNFHRLKKGYNIVIVARTAAATVEYDKLERAYFWAARKVEILNDSKRNH